MNTVRPQERTTLRVVSTRRHPRVSIEAQVSMESDSSFFAGVATNISEGGLFVATHQQSPIGTLVELRFSLPGHPEIQAAATVRWLRPYHEGGEEPPGMGLELVWIDEPSRAAIRAFVARRDPIFWE